MKILLSIKPEFAHRIFDGSKIYEYRRVIFKRKDIKTVVVYATSPTQKVVGEFDIDDIKRDDPMSLWLQTREKSGINYEDFLKYFKNKKIGYAIKIVSPRRYHKPKSLTSLNVMKAPRSFIYLPD
jgi:predicted transcriptional regulator